MGVGWGESSVLLLYSENGVVNKELCVSLYMCVVVLEYK